MSNKFHTLTISELIQETPEATSIVFDIPDNIQELFNYKQGQYFTLKTTLNNEEIRRAYSMSSSPIADKQPKITVKKVENGKMSNFLCSELKVGDQLEVMPPMGTFFTDLDKNNAKTYVLFAAGSGITPLMSILKTTLEVEQKSKVVLFYGNKSIQSTIFKSELDELNKKYQDRLVVKHILSREPNENGHYDGRIDKEKATYLLNKYIDTSSICEYFACGPGGMIEDVKGVLQGNNISKENIHIEYFTSDLEKKKETPPVATGTGGSRALTIILDDQEYNLELKDGETVLDAAISADIDPPYSCHTGVCTTCKAFVQKGKTEMVENLALDEDEVEEGYVLTCQCIGVEGDLVISYDE